MRRLLRSVSRGTVVACLVTAIVVAAAVAAWMQTKTTPATLRLHGTFEIVTALVDFGDFYAGEVQTNGATLSIKNISGELMWITDISLAGSGIPYGCAISAIDAMDPSLYLPQQVGNGVQVDPFIEVTCDGTATNLGTYGFEVSVTAQQTAPE